MHDSPSLQCCGRVRAGRFCPDCGRRLRPEDDDLVGLVVHCRKVAEKFANEATNLEKEASWPEAPQWAAKKRATSRKWGRWADELARLIAGSGARPGEEGRIDD